MKALTSVLVQMMQEVGDGYGIDGDLGSEVGRRPAMVEEVYLG